MIELLKGNIIESKAQAIINTVNTKGVMGKGIALQYKKAFPEMFEEYKKACKSGQVVIGKMHVWQNKALFGPKYIINFPTKDDWEKPSKLEYIEKGLADLVTIIKQLAIDSIAIPPLGCGNGRLSWKAVKPLIIKALKDCSNVKVELFEPSDAPELMQAAPVKEKKMTGSRALVLKLFQRYCVLGYELTLLEAQKLCFFLQELGEPLKLRFQKHHYGPYADNLRHVLIGFEGKYTQGFVDGTKNKPETVIHLLPRAIEESDDFIKANGSSMESQLARLKMVENFIEGFETPFGMELLSTVYWVVKYDGIPLSDEKLIVDAVHAWNPRKAELMKPKYIRKAINRIAELGVFTNTGRVE
jgi:O-acetyl-ADP-ribose deacetylase (regulator of RNase III)